MQRKSDFFHIFFFLLLHWEIECKCIIDTGIDIYVNRLENLRSCVSVCSVNLVDIFLANVSKLFIKPNTHNTLIFIIIISDLH